MTIAEKKDFVKKNYSHFFHGRLKIYFSTADSKFNIEDLDKCIARLRRKNSFALKGFNQKLLSEELFTFTQTDNQMMKTHISGTWDKENTGEFKFIRKKGEEHVVLTGRWIPVNFHESTFQINDNEYFKSFLKIVNDYLSHCLEGWDECKTIVSLSIYTPANIVKLKDCISQDWEFYFQEMYDQRLKRPIRLSISKSNYMYHWLLNFINKEDYVEPMKQYYVTNTILEVSLDFIDRLKQALKVKNTVELKEFLKSNGIGKAGLCAFPVCKKGNYTYIENVDTKK